QGDQVWKSPQSAADRSDGSGQQQLGQQEPLRDADQVIQEIEANPDIAPEDKVVGRQVIEGLKGKWGYAFKENYGHYGDGVRAMARTPEEAIEVREFERDSGLYNRPDHQILIARFISRMVAELKRRRS